jgi:3-isopropylmalate dehydrogenase
VATQESVNTRHGVERVLRYAFETAQRRDGRLTLVHKTNVLTHAGGLWMRTFEEVGDADFPDVERDYVHVDAACLYFVTQPERFDVVVTENLFGDIITDLGAAVQGGMGLAASGNLDPTRRAPSMFEPVHGSAPDIAGTGRADPVAAVMSLGQLLAFLGEDAAAGRVDRAVAALLAERHGAVPDGAGYDDRRRGRPAGRAGGNGVALRVASCPGCRRTRRAPDRRREPGVRRGSPSRHHPVVTTTSAHMPCSKCGGPPSTCGGPSPSGALRYSSGSAPVGIAQITT